MRRLSSWLLAAALVAPALDAQQTPRATTGDEAAAYQVKTVPLRHLSNSDAVLLLSPYVSGHGGVYPVGTGMHAVTVRGSSATIAEAERLLAQYDRSPAAVSLNFQLIAADNMPRRDASLAGIDSVLRGVLKFTGYHLLTSAVASVSEGGSATQGMSADGNDYRLTYTVSDVDAQATAGSVHVRVHLERLGDFMIHGVRDLNPTLLRGDLTIPIGHTVVLGSTVEASMMMTSDRTAVPATDRALILTVRPQLVLPAKED